MLYKILYVEKALKLITKIEDSSKYRLLRFAGYTQYRKEVQTTVGGKAPAEMLWQHQGWQGWAHTGPAGRSLAADGCDMTKLSDSHPEPSRGFQSGNVVAVCS